MSSQRRRDAATATVGLSGVAAGGALRHSALESAYGDKPRPRMWQERKFLTRAKVPGRRRYAAAMALGLVSVPPAAVGSSRVMRKRDDKHRSFIGEGIQGAKASFTERNKTIAERPPAPLVAGNYAAGAGIGSAAGGLTHLALGRTRLPGAARSAAAAAAGVLAGSASLPAQSKLTQRASHGKYEVTPTGVRRKRTPAKRPSSTANVIEGRPGKGGLTGHALREQMVGKMSPREAPAVLGAHWTTRLSQAADRIEPYSPRRAKPKPRPIIDRHLPNAKKVTGRLVHTGRVKAAETVRAVSYDVSSLNDKDKLVREVATGQGRIQKDDPGASMSRAERRARVTASGVPIPVVGDIAQAATAASLSPEKYRRRTAVQNYAGGTAGGLAGNAAGAAGALALARHSPGFNSRAVAANDKIDSFKTSMRSKARMKPAGDGPGATSRALHHPKTPQLARRGAAALAGSRAARAVAANPKVAAVGALAGGAVGGQVAQQATYSHIMRRDDRYRRQHNVGARRGSKVGKADAGTGMSRRQELEQIRRKRRSAAISATSATGSVAATGLLGASYAPKFKGTVRGGKLRTASFGLGTAAGGIGAGNSLWGSRLQRRDLKAREHVLVGKAGVGVLRPTGIRRAPAMRRGFIRQTRSATGTRTTYVRGGLA